MMEKGPKRPQPPPPQDYERLRRAAEELRQLPLSGRSARDEHRRRLQRGMHNYIRYTGIGMQFVLLLLLPVGLGYLGDRWWGTSPWLVVAGAAVGSVAAMVWVVRAVVRMEESTRRREGKGDDRP
jgi:F0F1-type ATP synthase assembly protein I